MWKPQTAKEEEEPTVIGVIVRSVATGETLATLTVPMTALASLNLPLKSNQKLLPRVMPRILPAPGPSTSIVTTTAGTTTTLTCNSATIGKKAVKAKPKIKAKKKIEPKILPATSSVAPLKPVIPEANFTLAHEPQPSTSYAPPPLITHSFASMPISMHSEPSTSESTNNNGLRDEDLNAIEIAHSIRHDHEQNRGYWTNSDDQGSVMQANSHPQVGYYQCDHGTDQQYLYQQNGYNAQLNGHYQGGGFHVNGVANSQNANVPTTIANGNGYYGAMHLQSQGHAQHGQQVWRPLINGQGQYGAVHNQNQMTSSTPDSGIQSIDGSPPSTSAFTPPMVSPYAVQGNHFEHNQLQNIAPSHSHVQLPPLNCVTGGTATSSSNSTLMPPPPAPPLSQPTSTPSTSDQSYLDQQHPSCSYTSPPILDNKTTMGDSFDNDSDCDYSDMPTLFPAEGGKPIDYVVPSTPNSIEPEPFNTTTTTTSVTGVSESRSASRISSIANAEHRSVSVANENRAVDGFAISATMDADQIVEVLKSSLGVEKLQELLRKIQPTQRQPSPSPSPAPPSVPVKQTRSKKRKATPPPQLAPMTNVKPSKASCSAKPPKLAKQTTVIPDKTDPKSKKVATKKSKGGGKPKRTVLAPIVEPNPSTSTKVVKKVISKSLYSRCYRHREPIRRGERVINTISSAVRAPGTTNRPWKTMTLCTEDAEIDQLLNGYSSEMLGQRYANNIDMLADALQETHLNIPKVDCDRFEPSGSWKMPVLKPLKKSNNRRRKVANAKTAAVVPSKQTKNVPTLEARKLSPLRISISSRTPSTSTESAPTAPKSKRAKKNPVTPVPKDDYIKIRSLVQTDALPKMSLPTKACNCTLQEACASNSCITREGFVECSNYSCQLYGPCQNRRLTNNIVVHQLQTFQRPHMNLGVRATVDIFAGQLVCEFVGETLRKETYQRRLKNGQSFARYAVELIPNAYVVDASRKGNLSRFMNHSCNPTCIMSRWMVNGIPRLGIFAINDIPSGLELTYDYGMHVFHQNLIDCKCGTDDCVGVLPSMPPPKSPPSQPPKLSPSETRVANNSHRYLKRNLRQYTVDRNVKHIQSLSVSSQLHGLSKVVATVANKLMEYMSKKRIPRRHIQHIRKTALHVFKTTTVHSDPIDFVQRFDASTLKALALIMKSLERVSIDPLKHAYLNAKLHSKIFDTSGNLHVNAIHSFSKEKHKIPHSNKAQNSPKIPEIVDLSYMETGAPIGSYDPDKDAIMQVVVNNRDSDCIRCVCGIIDDAGTMYQCDQCNYWLHKECLMQASETKDFICDFCKYAYTSTPLLDILLDKQPSVVIESCVYYKTMVNHRGIQARVNECVYVEMNINDEYKSLLSKFNQDYVANPRVRRRRAETQLPPAVEPFDQSKLNHNVQKLFQRTEVRVFRIDRLIRVPTGERFAFGFYYARPHETFIDPTRTFYRNELLATPLFDTLPIDTIVGRCLVLEPAEFAAGRPRGPKYREEDIYICEYSVDRSQKVFDKITGKNRYPLHQCSYTFDNFEKPLVLKRTLNPFNPNQEAIKTSPKHTKKRNAEVSREVCGLVLEMAVKKIKKNSLT